MAERVLFIGWNRSSVGREQQALALFMKSMEYYNKLQSDDRIESFDSVILENHGGDLNGFVLIKGEADKITDIRRDDEFIDLTMEAGYRLDGFGVVEGYVGEGIMALMPRYEKFIGG
jgi:hypothetical protein